MHHLQLGQGWTHKRERQYPFLKCGVESVDSVEEDFWLCNLNTVLALVATHNFVAGSLGS